ncbi:MAG TPA: hypothetical protein VL306_03175 [Methylomirabilota bacterium]|jgi:hypothetical protein|nr:hypothetical protein [Methylomirabilota bacterium]
MTNYQKLGALAALLFIFSAWFFHNVKNDLPAIFQKDLLAHDESSNSVVAANLTRQFFPPAVRVNPLNEAQGVWMEGPQWQHIPPLFAYVPYVFFKLDGRVTIEMKRLSYAFVVLLTGLLFILFGYLFSKNLWAVFAAFVASVLWICTPFTRKLIYGGEFGVSDIVLAFTCVCAFGGLLWYLNHPKEERINYKISRLIGIAVLVALPILAKNLLGAIPAAIFFILLLRDYGRIGKKFLISLGIFIATLFIYYFPFYLASPQTFKTEIFVAFFHAKNLEGWGRPWHWYLTNYLPQRYLFNFTWPFYLGLVFGIWYSVWGQIDRKNKILLNLSLGWFLWNLIVVSIVQSKVPNFIYQSYLFSLFGIVLSLTLVRRHWIKLAFGELIGRLFRPLVIGCLILALLLASRSVYYFTAEFHANRAQAYSYQTEHEKFYQIGEWMQAQNYSPMDLTVVRVSDNDCWFRYYILFLTGAESKTLLELSFSPPAGDLIKQKYRTLNFIVNKSEVLPKDLTGYARIELGDYSFIKFNLMKLNATDIQNIVQKFIIAHQQDIQKEILRIKKDKTSCQWLVPDPILNAP